MTRFSDDIILLAISEKDLQTALVGVDNILLIFTININAVKT